MFPPTSFTNVSEPFIIALNFSNGNTALIIVHACALANNISMKIMF